MNNNERVYCERCPIVNVCYGNNNEPTEPHYADDCILAKLYYGELKVSINVTGYVTKE